MDIFKNLEKELKNLEKNMSSKTVKHKIDTFIKGLNIKLDDIVTSLTTKEMDTKYDHSLVEKQKALRWKFNNFLEVKNKKNKPFCIILPPPNVTGKLHLGHAWNSAIQDTIIRFKRSKGFDTLFIPSMDHAGIATQAKVESELAKDNVYKEQLGRDKFIDVIWDWKIKYAKNIRKQWDSLGITFDFIKEKFTLDDGISQAVNKAFIDMYNDGLIYRGERAINWDCKLQTSLSNIEVIPKMQSSQMYYLKYKIQGTKDFLIIATTRVETLFSDVAIAINPRDKRFIKFVGKKAINPLTKKLLIIIKDKYVQMDKGTGAMKVSAHATADIDIIKNNDLQVIECIDKQGKMNKIAKEYSGLDRFVARKQIIEKLSKLKMIDKIENINNNIGYSQRSDTVVEILVSKQWFIKTKPLAKLVLNNMKNTKEAVQFFPTRFSKTLVQWMENIEDWNISRQLWWGHQIPVWYKEDEVKVQVDSPGIKWKKDPDVLDTWFSSSLAPFSFLNWPVNNTDLKQYYPTSLLVSAYDIIFFWIARMYFNGLYFQKTIPFKQVLIHGLIRDAQGRKMSKSLGNGIDPFDLINKYGADSLRWFLLTTTTAGQDLTYSEEKIKSSWNFMNKIWNISRFIISIKHEHESKKENDHDRWILNKLNVLNRKITRAYNKYEFTLIKKHVEHFVYNEFSSWYIEMSKDRFHKATACKVLSDLAIMLHPIIPFITEDIYMKMHNNTISTTKWPTIKQIKKVSYIDDIIEMVKAIREFRVLHNLSPKDIVYYMIDKQITMKIETLIYKLANAKVKKNNDSLFILTNYKLNIQMDKQMKLLEKERLTKEINNMKQEIIRSEKILNNKKFIQNASKQKIQEEEEKYLKYKKHCAILISKQK